MDIVFLLDRSGSMSGMEEDTIGGYNSYLDSQRKNNVKVTTVLFDNEYEIIALILPNSQENSSITLLDKNFDDTWQKK